MNEPSDGSESTDTTAYQTKQSGQVRIESEDDILRARQKAREITEDMGFSITDVTRTVTAVSELARNIHLYTDHGVMHWRAVKDRGRAGIELVFDDDGPGIDDVSGVLRGDHSTSDGMGRGIEGTKSLMDDFDLTSSPEDGTTITIRKWN